MMQTPWVEPPSRNRSALEGKGHRSGRADRAHGDAGPVRASLGGKILTGRFVSILSSSLPTIPVRRYSFHNPGGSHSIREIRRSLSQPLALGGCRVSIAKGSPRTPSAG